MDSKAKLVELDKLIGLFYDHSAELGAFVEVSSDHIPEPQRSLLDHDFHMTVTVEKFHSAPVNVTVHRDRIVDGAYCREICLSRQSDHQVVQYGIVRLDFRHLGADVQTEIESREKPLGRILIEHDVLRRVQLLSLYEIAPSKILSAALQSESMGLCYGRTALIYCNEDPAIELLEIVRID